MADPGALENDLADILQPPQHEVHAHQFIDQAKAIMAQGHPDITFFVHDSTGIDIDAGGQALKTLGEWSDPKMAPHRDSGLKESLQEDVAVGNLRDIESVDLARIECAMLGDDQLVLEDALKEVTLLAAEKGGKLDNKQTGNNILRVLQERDPDGDWSHFAKKLSLRSMFIFT